MTSSLIKQSSKQEFKRFCLNISGKLNLHQILPILFRLITSLKDKGQQLLFLRGNIAPYRTRWLSVPSNTWPLCACWHQPGRNFQMNLYLEVQKPLLTKMINFNWHFKIKIKKNSDNILTPPAFELRLRKCKHRGFPMPKSSVLRIRASISLMSFFWYALSVMYTKSATSGAYISSYLEAISMAVTPTNWSLLRGTGYI